MIIHLNKDTKVQSRMEPNKFRTLAKVIIDSASDIKSTVGKGQELMPNSNSIVFEN